MFGLNFDRAVCLNRRTLFLRWNSSSSSWRSFKNYVNKILTIFKGRSKDQKQIYEKSVWEPSIKDVGISCNIRIWEPSLPLKYSEVFYWWSSVQSFFKPLKYCLKSWMRKVRTSSRHLLAEIRAIHGTWYTSIFLRNETFLFVKIRRTLKFSTSLWFTISWNLTKYLLIWTTLYYPHKNVI